MTSPVEQHDMSKEAQLETQDTWRTKTEQHKGANYHIQANKLKSVDCGQNIDEKKLLDAQMKALEQLQAHEHRHMTRQKAVENSGHKSDSSNEKGLDRSLTTFQRKQPPHLAANPTAGMSTSTYASDGEDEQTKYQLQQTLQEATAQLQQIQELRCQLQEQAQQLSEELSNKTVVSFMG